MTYKAIVENLIRTEAQNWIEKLLEDNNIKYSYTFSDGVKMENDKDKGQIYWDATFDIILSSYERAKLTVGGTADDYFGICKSVIWNNQGKIIWMSTDEARKELNINEFKVA